MNENKNYNFRLKSSSLHLVDNVNGLIYDAKKGGFPFSVKIPKYKPEVLDAMEEAMQARTDYKNIGY